MRVGYLGPEGTLSEEALLAAPQAGGWERVALPSLGEVLRAVEEGVVDRGIVPIENSLEGAVRATLDALAFETSDVVITAELVHPVSHSLVARPGTPFDSIETVASHPGAIASSRRFLRQRLPHAAVLPFPSSAAAVRTAAHRPGWAALGTRRAAEIYGATVLHDRVDDTDNETRYVLVARGRDAQADGRPHGHGPRKTSLVFWGAGAGEPGWLVRCLQEFAERGVDLSRIESRPRRGEIGSFAFFLDFEGAVGEAPVDAAVAGLRAQAAVVRVLGSYPAAA